jgi:hypothetical protein
MNDSNFLKEIGRSYIVSAFLPAAIFILLGFFLFRGFLPVVVVEQMTNSQSFATYQWVILTLLIFWIAFYLFSADDVTVRIFEGYIWPEWLKNILINRQKKDWDKKNLNNLRKWEKSDRAIHEKIKKRRPVTEKELEQNVENLLRAHEELALLGTRSPLSPDDLMPTKLGNVLRASEMYAYERYAIEEITIWPRLMPVLPPEIVSQLEEKNNHFMFLINSAFMAYVNAIISFLFGVFGLPVIIFHDFLRPLLPRPNSFFYIGYDFIPPLGFLLISILLAGFGYMLYLIAVNVAEDFGMSICASFDLYRINLIRQFNWPHPKTLEEERDLWRDITKFLIASDRLGDVKFPKYEYADLPAPSKKPRSTNKRHKSRASR